MTGWVRTQAGPLSRIERQYIVHGRRTTIPLEAAYWDAVDGMANDLGRSVSEVITEACSQAKGRSGGRGEAFNRAIRVWAVQHFRRKLEKAERVREG